MPRISVELILPVPPERVWNVLTDFESYGQWHPYQTIDGTAEPLSIITIKTHTREPAGVSAERAIIWKSQPATRLEIIGGRLAKRFFLLEPHPQGTRLRHGYRASDLWVNPIFAPAFRIEKLRRLYEEFSRALEKRVISPQAKSKGAGKNRHERRASKAKKGRK